MNTKLIDTFRNDKKKFIKELPIEIIFSEPDSFVLDYDNITPDYEYNVAKISGNTLLFILFGSTLVNNLMNKEKLLIEIKFEVNKLFEYAKNDLHKKQCKNLVSLWDSNEIQIYVDIIIYTHLYFSNFYSTFFKNENQYTPLIDFILINIDNDSGLNKENWELKLVAAINYLLGRSKTKGSIDKIILYDRASLLLDAEKFNSNPTSETDKRLTNIGKALTKHWHRDITDNFWISTLKTELILLKESLGWEKFYGEYPAKSVSRLIKTSTLCGSTEAINKYSMLVFNRIIDNIVWVNCYIQQAMIFLELRIEEGYGFRWQIKDDCDKLIFIGVVEPHTENGFENRYRH